MTLLSMFGKDLRPFDHSTIGNLSAYSIRPTVLLADLTTHAIGADVSHGELCGFVLPMDDSATLPATGAFVYPPGGGQWWHTNSNLPGRRIYAAYSETGESGMVFYKDGKVIVDQDKPGWNVREFVVPCWHAVWSECWRTSYGFNIGVEA